MANNILLREFDSKNFSNKESLNNLIRVLSRISTIPKLNNINIFSSKQYYDRFKINPGVSIILGEKYLKNPVLAILYLRYGFEWQLWYENYGKDDSLASFYDAAAYKVSKHFYDLLSLKDRLTLKSDDFILTQLFNSDVDYLKIHLINSTKSIEKLRTFHNINIKETKVNNSDMLLLEFLAKPCEYLMMEGGDDRLKVGEINLLNKYGCTPFPRPEALTFASSTATSISNYAFDNSDRLRGKLIKKSHLNDFSTCLQEYFDKLKSELRKALGLKKNYEVVFSPSGTDSSLQLAAIMQITTVREITHILVGAEETGSGVPTALKGRNFELSTALGQTVYKDELIDGFRPVELELISLRNEEGRLKDNKEIDKEVMQKLEIIVAENKFAVLHTIDQSKLGYSAPSSKMLKLLNNFSSLDVQIVVDASQLRLDSVDINNYLESGYIVTITGSKFFTGPPYSGALLIPEKLNAALNKKHVELPTGLNKYFYQSDWPNDWICSNFLVSGFNLGTLMRWKAATSEMQRYFNTPLLYRNLGIEMFCSFVHESIIESEFLEPLYKDFSAMDDNREIGLKKTRTIFPFFLLKDNIVLNSESVKIIYNLLNSDLSLKINTSDLDSKRLAATKCHIGQGVKVLHKSGLETSVLRISLGSRVISESWKERDISLYFRNIQEQMSQVSIIVKKIELIITHLKLFL